MANYKLYWPLVLEDLQQKVSAPKWEAWFANISLEKINVGSSQICLSVPSKFNKTYLESNYKTLLLDSVRKFFPNVEFVDIEVKVLATENTVLLKPTPFFSENSNEDLDSSLNNSIPSRYEKNQNSTNLPQTTYGNTAADKTDFLNSKIHNLNHKLTFENYVVAGFNELVVSVSKSILKKPGHLYNPLFIHSPTGLGKTHLLQAIGHKYLEIYPTHNIKYISTEKFLNHYVSSMQRGKSHEFREYYRTVDLLLIDDIQFISGKASTQEAFFHTFNELHQMNKQIIITADKNPKLLVGIEERLVSRFEWGMVCELTEPSLEDRLAVIQDKVFKRRMAVTESQMLQIAKNVNTNFRDIEGVLNKIEGYITLNPGSFIKQEILDSILNPYLKMLSAGLMHFSTNGKSENTEFDPIFEVITNKWNANKADICSKKRDKHSVLARQILMYVLHRYCKVSMSTIGKLLGGRDHTTIVYGCQKIEDLMKSNFEIQVKVRNTLEELNLETGLF